MGGDWRGILPNWMVVTANGWAPEGLAIDRRSVVPIYRQLYERLREQILTGALPRARACRRNAPWPGGCGVNRSTVVHGYRELVADGLIEQRVGSGSRVAALREGARSGRAGCRGG